MELTEALSVILNAASYHQLDVKESIKTWDDVEAMDESYEIDKAASVVLDFLSTLRRFERSKNNANIAADEIKNFLSLNS